MSGAFAKKMTFLLRRNRFRSELDEEMAFHRAQAAQDLVADGMKPDDARYAAMRQLGNATRLREQSEEVVGFRLETVWQDVRFAARQLRKNPGFGVTAVLILALGMGVSVAIFSFVDAALIRPLPFEKSNRLVDLDEKAVVFPRSNLSRQDYEDWKRMNTTLSSLEVYTGTGFLLHQGATTEPVPAARVSDGFFRTLGVKPILGRDFLPGEDQPGRAKIVLLSYGGWQRRFGGRADVIGQTVNLSGDAYTIVGVLPTTASYAPRGGNRDFFVPLLDETGCEKRRSCHNLDGVGRLRDGVTVDQARGDLERIAAQLEKQYPGSNKEQGAEVQPLKEFLVGSMRPVLLTLLAGAGLLLSDCVRECGQPAAGAGREPAARGGGARGAGGFAIEACPAVCDRGDAAGGGGLRGRRAGGGMDDDAGDPAGSEGCGCRGDAISGPRGDECAHRPVCCSDGAGAGLRTGGDADAAAQRAGIG